MNEVGLEPAQLGQAALDIRAYYEEAALALAVHVPAARQAESWLTASPKPGAYYERHERWFGAADAPPTRMVRAPSRRPTHQLTARKQSARRNGALQKCRPHDESRRVTNDRRRGTGQ